MEPKKVSITQLIADGHTFYVVFLQARYGREKRKTY